MNLAEEPRYYKLFVKHLQDYAQFPQLAKLGHVRTRHTSQIDKGPDDYDIMRRVLKSPNTKRLIFDARQAAIFDKSNPIQVEGMKIVPPFDQLYIEFTEGVQIQIQEPGYFDKLVGIIFINQSRADIPVQTPEGIVRKPGCLAAFILYNEEKGQWVDRKFWLSIEDKVGYPSVLNARETDDPSQVPEAWDNLSWFPAGMEIPGMPNRRVGWWENAVIASTNLLLWMFSYTMAKSVKIKEVTIQFSRQQRRQNERKGYIPEPWHKVYVEPKLIESKISPESIEERDGPAYRFDVITHLRFNKHKIKDGSWRYTVEVVPAHQRGLKNEIYIPKTYVVKKGKKPLPEMEQYFGQKVDFKE